MRKDDSAKRQLERDNCRAPGEKTDRAVESLRKDAPAGREIRSLPVDFASLESVRALAAQFLALDAPTLQAIVCNAGTQSFRRTSLALTGLEAHESDAGEGRLAGPRMMNEIQ